MKFGKLMKYKMRNIFLQKSYRKCGGGGEARLTAFHQKLK